MSDKAHSPLLNCSILPNVLKKVSIDVDMPSWKGWALRARIVHSVSLLRGQCIWRPLLHQYPDIPDLEEQDLHPASILGKMSLSIQLGMVYLM